MVTLVLGGGGPPVVGHCNVRLVPALVHDPTVPHPLYQARPTRWAFAAADHISRATSSGETPVAKGVRGNNGHTGPCAEMGGCSHTNSRTRGCTSPTCIPRCHQGHRSMEETPFPSGVPHAPGRLSRSRGLRARQAHRADTLLTGLRLCTGRGLPHHLPKQSLSFPFDTCDVPAKCKSNTTVGCGAAFEHHSLRMHRCPGTKAVVLHRCRRGSL